MRIEVALGQTVEYIEAFYSKEEADDILRALLAVDMTPEVIRMYGRDTITKRRSACSLRIMIFAASTVRSR